MNPFCVPVPDAAAAADEDDDDGGCLLGQSLLNLPVLSVAKRQCQC